jgi:hypothetical protein
MKSREARLLDGERVAFILGDSIRSRLLALKLRMVDKLCCAVCDTKRSAGAILLPTCPFLKLCQSTDASLLLLQLEDLALYGEDTLKFLVVYTEAYAQSIKDIRDILESRYIVTDKDGIRTLLKNE